MKRIIVLTTCILLMLALTGCAKVVRTEEKNVTVTVESTYHRAAWIQPIKAGKVTTMITHPAQHKVYVMYEGQKLTINNSTAYRLCKGKNGQEVNATIRELEYEDGTISYRLLSINE